MAKFVSFEWPNWAVMWALALGIYLSCKLLTWVTSPVRQVPAWKHAAYLLAWPGLDAAGFLEKSPTSNLSYLRPNEWIEAIGKLIFGVALLFGVARMIPPQHPYLVGWIGMIGIIMILHFGLLHLLSCLWRSLGVQARPLMNHPLASKSLSEFWGRRWNTAFRDLTYRFLFRPCTVWFGPRWGILAGFLFSGVIHDLVISVPAYGGYVVLSIVAFAVLSILNPHELASGSGLARGFCTYVAVFWGIRLALQFVFDVREHLTALWLKAGYVVLTLMFAAFTIVYALAALH